MARRDRTEGRRPRRPPPAAQALGARGRARCVLPAVAQSGVASEPRLDDAAAEQLSLTQGGPAFRLAARLRLAPDDPRRGRALAVLVVVVAWLPIGAAALVERLLTGRWDPFALRGEAHVRLLIALPLLLLAEGSLERRAADATRQLVGGGLLGEQQRTGLRALLARLARWRDARWPELLWLATVYGAVVLALAGAIPGWLLRWLAPTLHGGRDVWGGVAPAWWWYVLVGQPLLLFVLGRWLLRWAAWSVFGLHLARLAPRVQPAHTDRAGGLAFLVGPLTSLRLFVLALAATIAAVWADEVAVRVAKPAAFANDLVVLLGISLTFALAPYLPLTPLLVSAKRRAALEYSALLGRYLARFEARWLASREADPQMLGHEDFSGLNDLGASCAVVSEMRVLVPSPGDVKALLLCCAVPILGLIVAFSGSAAEVARRLLLRFLMG